MSGMGGIVCRGVTVPQEMVDAIETSAFFSHPLWLVAMLEQPVYPAVISFILIMAAFFRLYILLPRKPDPSGDLRRRKTSFMRKQFIKSYIGVARRGGRSSWPACFAAFMSAVPRFWTPTRPPWSWPGQYRGDYFQYAGVGWPGKVPSVLCENCSGL